MQKFWRPFRGPVVNKLATCVVACFLLSVSSLSANTVVPIPGGGGQWYTGVTPDQINGDAFWDNASRDGNGCNVGYWLGGTVPWGTLLGRCNNDGGISAESSTYTVPGGPLGFYASKPPTGTAATPVGWEFMASGPNNIEMEVEVAGWRNSNILGYYTYDSSGNKQYSTSGVGSTVIFNGAANALSAPKTISFTDTQKFGFFICPAGNCSNIMFSGSQYNTTDPSLTKRAGKFALFSEDPSSPGPGSDIKTYWVGVEDLKGLDSVEKWGDYNDIVFRASVKTTGGTPVGVAEPGFYSQLAVNLAGLLAGLAFLRFRRQTIR